MEIPERDLVTLNIGGIHYLTRGKTLRTFPDTRLGRLSYKSDDYFPEQNFFYFDRSPTIFPFILDAYRTGTFHFPSHICIQSMREEMAYWDLRVCDTLSMCCIGKYQAFEERSKAMEEICNASLFELKSKVRLQRKANRTKGLRKWRYKMWYFLERPSSSKAAQVRALFHIGLVFANIFVFAMMSSRDFNVPTRPLPNNMSAMVYRNKSSEYRVIQADKNGYAFVPLLSLRIGSICINAYFLLEFLLRFFIAFDKCDFFKSVVTVSEVMCIMASVVFEWLLFHAAGHHGLTMDLVRLHDLMAFFFVLRLIVCFRLSRNYVKLGAIVLSLRSSVVELFLFSLLLFTAISFFGVLIFMCEWGADPRKIHTIPEAFWWAIITMSTVGFGDFVPVTTAGYIVGSFCALCGIVLTGLAISILSHNLKVYSDYSLQRERASRLFSERCVSNRVDSNRIAIRGRKFEKDPCCHLQGAMNGIPRPHDDLSRAVYKSKNMPGSKENEKECRNKITKGEETDVAMLSYDLRLKPDLYTRIEPVQNSAHIRAMPNAMHVQRSVPQTNQPGNNMVSSVNQPNHFMDERRCPDGSTGESGHENSAFSSNEDDAANLEVSRI